MGTAIDAGGLLPDTSAINSWTQRVHEVDPMELLEVQLCNQTAPFILVSRLRPAMAASSARRKYVVNVSAMEVRVDPRAEWKQMYHESWRQMRDFFYDPDLHGVDWYGIRKKYEPLVDHVAHRADLTYVIGEMISELNVGHAYIDGGDFELPERPRVALPGARFELDEASGRYRISKIYKGHNEEPAYRSPLTEIGVDANVGAPSSSSSPQSERSSSFEMSKGSRERRRRRSSGSVWWR